MSSEPRLTLIERPDAGRDDALRVHGRLLESAHIAGYSFNRAADELDWLLQDDRWKGLGFANGHAFAKSIYDLFKEFKSSIEERKPVAQKLATIMSQRDVAKVLGVDESTLRYHRSKDAGNPAAPLEKPNEAEAAEEVVAGIPAPSPRAPWFERDADATAELLSRKARGTQGTGENEWYTPAEWLERARRVLGAFDLDPASSAKAQRRVKAARFFGIDDDGLAHEWHGRVWMNPPYAQPAIQHFTDKLLAEIDARRVVAAIALTHNYTDTRWFQNMAHGAAAICFPEGRIRFEAPDGTLAAPTQGQALFYFGKAVVRFAEAFGDAGTVVRVPR